MHLTVTGKQTDTGDALRRHVEASLGSILGKYFKTAIEAHVVFSKEAHMSRAEISIHIGRGIVVNAGAAQTESQQSCRGLLLSTTAEIDTRPQLQIHADEVKCSHGATTGRLDPDMLFYMLSRGLDRETAQSLLVYAFLADVLTDMSVPSARSAIEDALITQLPDSQLLNKFR